MRAGLRALLARDTGIEVVAEAGDGRAGIEAARRYRPDVVLMDLRMPRMDGIAATREIRGTSAWPVRGSSCSRPSTTMPTSSRPSGPGPAVTC
ncbi:response regulator transcription factor [Microbacterium lushaniae]|uniref:response regulator n=1 Tax=Microbacterium lushaniae TaxID=2614639 RepID=UPI003083F130